MKKVTFARFLAAALMALIVQSCGAASGKSFERVPPEGSQGMVYVYRVENTCLDTTAPDVLFDGRKIGALKNGGYLWKGAPSGPHVVLVSGVEDLDDIKLTLFVQEGEEHYVRWNPICEERWGATEFKIQIDVIDESKAAREITSTRLSQ
ncbi:MAG: DUF2846 domain-containing protein [Deltaproteobacteria bacterium]|nr:DUF2846 domain-containing protein [Deltaproteobacteria bacterium]